MSHVIGIVSRLCLLGALVLTGLGVVEKVLNRLDQTLLRGYDPWRLVEFSVVLLVFVIAIELQAIRAGTQGGR